MASINLPTKRINLEIIFWDLTIFLITLVRSVVRALPASLSINRKVLVTLMTWAGWILAGLSLGWFLGIASL